MSELGGWVSAPAVVTSRAGDGGPWGGDTEIPMDFGSSLDSKCSHTPTPSLLYRGDPEFSMCVPCLLHVCTGVLEEPGALLRWV